MRTVVFTLHMICLLLMGFIIDQTLSAAQITGKDNVKVTSSSQFSDWAPERIIDNINRNDAHRCGCCSATDLQLDPWYQLDFRKHYRVQRVYINGRHDIKPGQHFQNLQIFFESIHAGMKNVEKTEAHPVYEIDYILNVPKSTRFVSIILKNLTQYFVVCKLDVYGECADGEYGDTCNNVCHCKGDPCNKTTGVCPSGECLPGYDGQQCDKQCNKGRYGINCTKRCGNCKNDDTCIFTSGMCPTGCEAGYQSHECKTDCTDGTYGDGCVSQCGRCYNNTVCDKKSGICTGCAAGFKGVKCDAEETSSEKDSCSVPIGVAIGAILFIEAFVGVVVYIIWKRRQGQAERSSPQEVNIYEMPDREAFASEHPYELNQQSDTIIPTYENTLRSPTNE